MDLAIRKLNGPKTKVMGYSIWGDKILLLTYS